MGEVITVILPPEKKMYTCLGGGSLSLQALPDQFLHSATSEDPDLDTGFRDLRLRIAVNPALSSKTVSSYFLLLAYLGLTFCTLTSVKLLRLSDTPRV